MTRKQKQALRQRQSTRQLMGISQLTDHGVKVAGGELVFISSSPTTSPSSPRRACGSGYGR